MLSSVSSMQVPCREAQSRGVSQGFFVHEPLRNANSQHDL